MDDSKPLYYSDFRVAYKTIQHCFIAVFMAVWVVKKDKMAWHTTCITAAASLSFWNKAQV